MSLPSRIEHDVGAPGSLVAWARGAAEALERGLLESGALLLRGFDVGGTAGFRDFVSTTSGPPMDYVDRATPRSRVDDRVFTATDHPPPVEIFPHNENVYAARFPGRVFFHCVQPAAEGGQTPLADVRRVWERVPPAIREELTDRGVRYVRCFGRGMGLGWQEVFQTEDRAALERYCAEAGIHCEWQDAERLRTWQVRPAIAAHPVTGERVWLNHVATLHPSTLPPAKRRMLVKLFGAAQLPNDVRFGDGDEIPDASVAAIRAAYAAETREFAWAKGDVLVLDNLLVAHGRRPFRGRRELLVAMARPVAWSDVRVAG